MNELDRFLRPQEYQKQQEEAEQELRDKVISDGWLWDIRCWDRYTDPDEVTHWVQRFLAEQRRACGPLSPRADGEVVVLRR